MLKGRPIYSISVVIDITERKKAEEALRLSEERLRLATEASDAGHWDWNLVTYELTWNDKCKALFGLDPATKMTYDVFINSIDQEDRDRTNTAVQEAINQRKDYNIEFRAIWPDGTVRWILSKGRAFYDDGTAIRMSGIALDVTDRKTYQDERERVRNQLDLKNKELETIIGIVSHDLRAPLVNVKGFGNEIARDIQSLHTLLSGLAFEDKIKKQTDMTLHESIPESLRFIQASAEAMNNLVVTLTEVARAGFAPIKPEKLNMNELLHKILESIRIKFKAAKVSYDVERIPECFADSTQVSQIFRNLLDNAAK